MIGMAWENTLLASRILPPAYTPIEVSTNRSQDASLMMEQDGRLTLLIILTTSAGLAIVLLFFIFLRIGCLRGQSCIGRYKDRHDRSDCPLTTVVLDDHDSITKSLTASHQTIQTSFTQTRNDPPSDDYTIKMVDNDLIVETRDSSGCGQVATTAVTPTATLKIPNPARELFLHHDNDINEHVKSSSAVSTDDPAQSGFLILKNWLSGMKSKDLTTTEEGGGDDVHLGTTETKSLCGSPKRRHHGRSPTTHKQQIMAKFVQYLPGFGFTQSKSSCFFEEDDDDGLPPSYSYRNGNQFEYMGGPYGYVDPIYSHQLANNRQHQASIKSGRINNSAVRLEELDIVQHQHAVVPFLFGQSEHAEPSSADEQQPVLLLLPSLVRSAQSLPSSSE